MAEIVSVTASISAATAAPAAVAFPSHDIGTLLLVFAAQDGGAATNITTATTGWVMLGGTGAQASVAGCRSAWAYKIATNSSDDPSFTGANDEWTFIAYVIRDENAVPFGASPASGTDYVRADFDFTAVKGRAQAGALDTGAEANCLLLFGLAADNVRMRVSPGEMVTDAVAETTICSTTGHFQMGAAGTAPRPYGYANGQDGGNFWTIAIRNAASGKLQRDCRAGCDPIKWFGDYGTTYETLTYYKLSDVTTDTIDGVAISTTAVTMSHNISDPSNLPGLASRISAAGDSNVWQGVGFDITATDMRGKVISLQWQIASLTGVGVGPKGWIIVLSDGTDWKAYRLGYPAQTGLAISIWYKPQIIVGEGTAYAESSASALGDITKVGFGMHKTATDSRTLELKNFMLWDTATIIGGNADNPVQVSYWGEVVDAGGITEVQQLQSEGQMLGKSNLQIGDGLTPTYFDLSAQSFSYPLAYDAALIKKQWNAAPLKVGLTIKASTADTINLSAGVLASPTEQSLTIASDSEVPSSFSSSGTPIVGYTITDNKGLHWQNATFKSGGTVTIAGGGDLTNCTISKTTSTNAALAITADGSVLTSTAITVADTSVATDYHLELGTAVTAIELVDHTFTGDGAAVVSTISQKVHVLKTTGTVTITISGTTSLALNEVTSAGATVEIDAPQPTLDATVLANTRGVLYNRTTDAELDNTFVSGTSWSKTISSGASSGDVLDLYTFKEGYQESVATIIYSGADATFAVEQAVDDAIDYYRTEESITDYTDLTEFNFYAPDIYIQADDTDGATALKRLFIFYNGSLTTEDGARYMRGGITFRSAFDVVINRSVTPIAVDNVSATLGLYFTDEATIRVTTDDGTSWIAPPSAPGSIRYAFGVSPGQIETGVSGLTGPESSQLMGLTNAPSAAAVATAVWEKTLP